MMKFKQTYTEIWESTNTVRKVWIAKNGPCYEVETEPTADCGSNLGVYDTFDQAKRFAETKVPMFCEFTVEAERIAL